LANIREHKAETESNVASPRQAINQNREEANGLLNSTSGEVRTSIQECESQIQSVKHANESEIKQLNEAVSSLEDQNYDRVS
jgi:gas vesicle protein